MQLRRNVVGANGVKVLSAVNARREQLVNREANEIRAPSVVNARREQLAPRGAGPEEERTRAETGMTIPSLDHSEDDQFNALSPIFSTR